MWGWNCRDRKGVTRCDGGRQNSPSQSLGSAGIQRDMDNSALFAWRMFERDNLQRSVSVRGLMTTPS